MHTCRLLAAGHVMVGWGAGHGQGGSDAREGTVHESPVRLTAATIQVRPLGSSYTRQRCGKDTVQK